MFIRVLSLCLFTSLAFAQLDSNSVTVTSSKPSNNVPDQAVFIVSVTADASAPLSDVLAAVQSGGLGISNLTGLNSQLIGVIISANPLPVQLPQSIVWGFQVIVPLSKIKDEVATLTTLQQSVKKNTKFALSFGVSGTQTSAQSTPCVVADLLTDARTQAQTIAAAAQRTVGSIVSMSSTVSNSTGICAVTVKFGLLGS